MIFEELSGAVLIQRNGLPRVFANILQRRRDRAQIPRRLPTSVLQRPTAAKKSGKGGGMIVTGPALEVAQSTGSYWVSGNTRGPLPCANAADRSANRTITAATTQTTRRLGTRPGAAPTLIANIIARFRSR